jgi:hypothetical protein
MAALRASIEASKGEGGTRRAAPRKRATKRAAAPKRRAKSRG